MTNAALAQHTATVIGWVDNQPIPKSLLDDRLAILRAGKGSAALPAPTTREGRQLVRWTAHVLFAEHLCAAWARQHKLPLGIPSELDALSAIQLGSITAAAWRTHPAVSAVYRAVVNDDTETTQPTVARHWRLRIATGPTPEAATAANPLSIGWTTLDDLPVALAAAARNAVPLAPTPLPPLTSATPTSAPPTPLIDPGGTPDPAQLPTGTRATPAAAHLPADSASTLAPSAPRTPAPVRSPANAEPIPAAPHPPTDIWSPPAAPHSPTDTWSPPAASPATAGTGTSATPAAPHTPISTGVAPAAPTPPTSTSATPATRTGASPAAPGSPVRAGAVSTAPVASGGAWHVVVVDEVAVRPVAGAPAVRRAGSALRAFARWLDQERARSVRVAEGFEHPGDPGQPDNTHQH